MFLIFLKWSASFQKSIQVVKRAIYEGKSLTRQEADQVAMGLKAWATGKGATHYTHWFHPLTDGTAEKHDGFMRLLKMDKLLRNSQAKFWYSLNGCSSFPVVSTQYLWGKRIYCVGCFITGVYCRNTLCIPTIFVSWQGSSWLQSTLLKALSELDRAATDVCQYFDKDVTKVIATLGCEQNFLIDDALYYARPDIVLRKDTDGSPVIKRSAVIRPLFRIYSERVMAFIEDFECEAYKLGIPVKTRHNEVAPNQFESARSSRR